MSADVVSAAVMSDPAALLSGLVEQDGAPDDAAETLRVWAEPVRAELSRAGLLRGLAQLGTVLWAAGLAWAVQRGLDTQAGHRIPVAVAPGAALVLAGIALRTALLHVADRTAEQAARRVRASVRGRVLDAALPLSGPSRTALPDAAVAEALTREVTRLTQWLTEYVPARRTMLVGSGTVLIAIAGGNWFVALLLLAATPLLPLNLKVIGLGTQAVVHAQLSAVRRHSARLLDHLRGLPTLIGLGAEDTAALALREDDEELARRTQSVLRVAFLSTAWIELLITGTLAVVATYCGLVLLDYLHVPLVPDRMTLAQAVFVLVLTPAYFAPARDLARGYHARAEARAAAELIGGIAGAAATAHEPGTGIGTSGATAKPVPAAEALAGGIARGGQAQAEGQAAEPRPVRDVAAAAPQAATGTGPQPAPARDGSVAVRLDGVTVRFAGREAPGLDEVSFDVAVGEIVALSGPSGAGKSTLLAVAAGLAEPSTGHADVPAPAAVARVGQPARMFPGTVRENLLLARPGASDAELTAAFAALGLDGLLDALPQGLGTTFGERGDGLSSGQTQQLALARAQLRDGPLLVLDEPTAHLDSAARASVVAAVRALARGRTVLLATHDPALLPLADRVVELEKGRIL